MNPNRLPLPFRLAPPRDGGVDLLVVAGEHSGDEHAARMIREFRALRPAARVAAIGGPRLAEAGAQLLFDLTAASAIGYLEAIRRYPFFFRPLGLEIIRWVGEHRPKAVCGVDYGGFNLRLAGELRKAGLSVKGGGSIRTLQYISPQIWASRAGRRFDLARNLDALAAIFPFEPACYADTDLPVDFVGHPFLQEGYVAPVRYDPEGPVLLLPGSRRKAVGFIFPALAEAFAQFSASGDDLCAVVLYPSPEIRDTLSAEPLPPRLSLQPTGAAASASAVLMSSGTMSMHCALAGIPGAIVYRTDSITYWLGKLLVRVKHLGIANIVLGETMYPEYIQGAARSGPLAAELTACVRDPRRRREAVDHAGRLRTLLSQPIRGSAGVWLAERSGI